MGKMYRRSSSVQKPDVALTASSYYSGTTNTTSTHPFSTKQPSNSSVNTLVNASSLNGDDKVDASSYNYDKTHVTEISLSVTNSSMNNHDNSDLEASKQNSKSMLRRSLSLLSRKEEKQSSQLLKVHRYTIYDDEKGEFIEIIEEEWEGDGPPPKRSSNVQQRNTLMIDKDLPKLPESIENTNEEMLFARFHKWLEKRHPFMLEFYTRHKRTLLISVGLLLLLIVVIIILACVL